MAVSTGPFGSIWATIYGLVHRNPRSNRVVVDLANLRNDDRVLDVGCGAGAALEYAASIVTDGLLAGVDPTAKLARQASRRVPRAVIEVTGAESLPFSDDVFGVAWAISSYHHWPHPEAGLYEVRRVIEYGGRLLIAERHLSTTLGHGLDDEGVDRLRSRMVAAGYSQPTVSLHAAGRKEMVVVSARA